MATRPGANRYLRLALYGVPLLLAVAVRLGLASYFEFESQEDTVRAMLIVERGELPLYGIGHVRFLGAALGPLVYYLKAIPYLFTPDPFGEVVFLFTLHLGAMLFAMLLAADVVRDVLTNAKTSLSRQREWWPDAAGCLTGILMALSLHSQGLTSHAHPSYFAAAFMVPFIFGLYRYLVKYQDRWLILSGVCFGIMTQLYQLTLFAPVLMVILAVAIPRRHSPRAALHFVVPVAACYIPYLLSELVTGFWNTVSFFSIQPGPQDQSMVGASAVDNLLYLVNIFIEYVALPRHLDGLVLLAAIVGIGGLLAHVKRSPGARFFVIFAAFYSVLPAVLLGAPRFQLNMPASQFFVAAGILILVDVLRHVWLSGRALPKIVGGGVVLASMIFSVLFAHSGPDNELRKRLFYPMRMIFSYPVARTPGLAASRALMMELRRAYGAGLDNLSNMVQSPVAVSGFYGHHYLMRVVEDVVPAGEDGGRTIFVYDDRFPYDVKGTRRSQVGQFELVELAPKRVLHDTFMLRIDCDREWCAGRAGPVPTRPAVRFFWGCGEFRDLDARLSVPVEECEEMLLAPPHSRWYSGQIFVPSAPDGCPDCQELLFVGVSPECDVRVELDRGALDAEWILVNERKYGFFSVPDNMRDARRHDLNIGVIGCVPWTFHVEAFTGVAREAVPPDE